MPSIYFSELHAHHIYIGACQFFPTMEKTCMSPAQTRIPGPVTLLCCPSTQGNYPHTQCEQDKVISVGVRVSVYIYIYICVCVCVCTKFFLNVTLGIAWCI